MKKHFAIFIFNLIISLICLAVIVLYFVYPLSKIKVAYTISAESFREMVDDYDINAEEVLGGDDITVRFSFSLKPDEMVDSLTQPDAEQTLIRVINDNIDSILDGLNEFMGKLLETVLSSTAISVQKEIKNQLFDYLKSKNENITEEEAQVLFDNAGVTDEYLTAQTDAVIELLTSDGATVESVSESSVSAAQTVYSLLRENGQEFADLQFTEENEQAIRSSVESSLSEVADQNGRVDSNDFAAIILLRILRSKNGSSEALSPDVALSVRSLSDESAAESSSDTREELKEELNLFIRNVFPAQAVSFIRIIFIAFAALIIFSSLTWAYLLVKIIVKFFAKNPAIKLKVPILFGWLPFLLFWAIPTAVFVFLFRVLPLPAALSAFSFTFFSSGIFAFVAAILLIILWIPYRSLRKKAKEES